MLSGCKYRFRPPRVEDDFGIVSTGVCLREKKSLYRLITRVEKCQEKGLLLNLPEPKRPRLKITIDLPVHVVFIILELRRNFASLYIDIITRLRRVVIILSDTNKLF